MCRWGTHTSLRVAMPWWSSHTGKFRWAEKPVDSCIAPIIKALTGAGVYTAESCCGHGQYPGYIILHDKRILKVELWDGFEEAVRKVRAARGEK